jgi:hypothetical protein
LNSDTPSALIWRQSIGKHVFVIRKLHVQRMDFGDEKNFPALWLSFLFFLSPFFLFFFLCSFLFSFLLSFFLFVSYFFLHQAFTIRRSQTERKYFISFREADFLNLIYSLLLQ